MKMMQVSRFSDAFWGTDFCSTAGFSVLCRKVKSGNQTNKEFEDYIKQRIKIEEEYGRSLLRLAATMAGKQEIGSLRASFDTLREHVENTAKLHFELGKQMAEECSRINGLIDKHKEQRKKTEETMNKVQAAKKTGFKKVNDAKKVYDVKCQEDDAAKQALKAAELSMDIPRKEIDKFAMKQKKTQQIAEQSDSDYKSVIENLDQTRKTWEKCMTDACDTFQSMEEERISFLRNEMWVHTNLYSQFCVDVDQRCEEVRGSLEKCDINSDIVEFIRNASTGLEKPAPLPYINYYSGEMPLHSGPPMTPTSLTSTGLSDTKAPDTSKGLEAKPLKERKPHNLAADNATYASIDDFSSDEFDD